MPRLWRLARQSSPQSSLHRLVAGLFSINLLALGAVASAPALVGDKLPVRWQNYPILEDYGAQGLSDALWAGTQMLGLLLPLSALLALLVSLALAKLWDQKIGMPTAPLFLLLLIPRWFFGVFVLFALMGMRIAPTGDAMTFKVAVALFIHIVPATVFATLVVAPSIERILQSDPNALRLHPATTGHRNYSLLFKILLSILLASAILMGTRFMTSLDQTIVEGYRPGLATLQAAFIQTTDAFASSSFPYLTQISTSALAFCVARHAVRVAFTCLIAPSITPREP